MVAVPRPNEPNCHINQGFETATNNNGCTSVAPNKNLVAPGCTSRINPEQLPIPTVDLVGIGTQVWVFRVPLGEWLPGRVEEIEERRNKPELWEVRLTTGELLPTRSLEQLRLR